MSKKWAVPLFYKFHSSTSGNTEVTFEATNEYLQLPLQKEVGVKIPIT
jgi:hypothetical protein